MAINGIGAGPTRAGAGGVHPACVGFAMRIWARTAYGPEATLWRIWIAAGETTVAAEQTSGFRRELALGDGLARIWAIAAHALEG